MISTIKWPAFLILFIQSIALAVPTAKVSTELSLSSLQTGKPALLAVVVDIPVGFHAQSHTPSDPDLIPCQVEIMPVAELAIGEPIYPAGIDKTYPALGKLNIYEDRVIIYVPIQVKDTSPLGPVSLHGKVIYQLCDDKTCFPPDRPGFTFDTRIVGVGEVVTVNRPDLFPDKPIQKQNTTERKPDATEWHTVPGMIGLALLAGLIFNIMPCVLPVLPLKAIGFYEVSQHHRGRTMLLGAVFSAGVISIFVILALGIFLSKQFIGHQFSWGQQFSNPWFVWSVVAVLVVLTLAIWGVFSVRLPTSLYGINFRHDTLSGNFLWGGFTAILSTPCTAPFFPVVIAFAIGQPIGLGMGLMICVGVGMALPYFLLSAFPQVARKLPRTGPASELIKQMMGFLLLGTAGFFAGSRLFGENGQMGLVFTVALIASVYLIVKTARISRRFGPRAVAVTVALILSGSFLYLAISHSSTGDATEWVDYSPERLKAALAEGRPVLVKFTAKWCANCIVLERTVYREHQTIQALQKGRYLAMKLDVDKVGWDLLNQLAPGAGIPFTAIYRPGQDQPQTLASMHDTQTLVDLLTKKATQTN